MTKSFGFKDILKIMDIAPVYFIAIGSVYICILSILRKFNIIPLNKETANRRDSFHELLFLILTGFLRLLLNGFGVLQYVMNIQYVFIGLLLAFNIWPTNFKIRIEANENRTKALRGTGGSRVVIGRSTFPNPSCLAFSNL